MQSHCATFALTMRHISGKTCTREKRNLNCGLLTITTIPSSLFSLWHLYDHKTLLSHTHKLDLVIAPALHNTWLDTSPPVHPIMSPYLFGGPNHVAYNEGLADMLKPSRIQYLDMTWNRQLTGQSTRRTTKRLCVDKRSDFIPRILSSRLTTSILVRNSKSYGLEARWNRLSTLLGFFYFRRFLKHRFLQTQYHVGDICARNVDIAFSLSSALTLHLPVCHVPPNSTRLGRLTGGSSRSMTLSSLYLASPHTFVLLGQ